MMNQETRDALFEKSREDHEKDRDPRLNEIDRKGDWLHQYWFNRGVSAILPLLEKSMDANRFYGDKKNWTSCCAGTSLIEEDIEWLNNEKNLPDHWDNVDQFGGKTARTTLKEIESELKALGER